jgi:hypothetical protein
MTDYYKKAYFDKNHWRLWKISTTAKSLASVALVIFILFGVIESLRVFSTGWLQGSFSFNTMLLSPDSILFVLEPGIRLIIQALIYYVVLQGVSLGLRMVVETDINYRANAEENEE